MKYLKIKDFFSFQKNALAVQTARREPASLEGWPRPLAAPDYGLYRAMREAVPVIDAALDKIVRLTGSFRVECSRKALQAELDGFVNNVRVGAGSCGLHQFVSVYLDSLVTYGNAVGEIVPEPGGGDIAALYNAGLRDIHIRQGESPLDAEIGVCPGGIGFEPVRYPQLVLFTPLNPPAGEIAGTPLLRSLPFVTSVLLKIFSSTATNFERIGNLRYAVTYRPGASGADKAWARDIAANLAREWADAMSAGPGGPVKDFVAVGDVDIKVIGADNRMIATEVPVRQMLEQIVAKLGIPPFMLGLHWSTTERMSTQQADILTSELESYRRVLNAVILKICGMWMRMKGYGAELRVAWDDINLQDEMEAARARLYSARADSLCARCENGNEKEKETEEGKGGKDLG